MTDSHSTSQKKDRQPHYPSLFLTQYHPTPPFPRWNQFILSITENKQSILTNCWLCKERQNRVGKVCKNRAAFKTAVWSLRNQLSVRRSRLCEGENPPRRSGEGTLGGLGYACTPSLHSQPFKMPYHHHTSVKIETECIICERKSRALNLDWLI